MKEKAFPRWVSYLPIAFLGGVIIFSLYIKAGAMPLSDAAYDVGVTELDGDAINTYQTACSSVSVSTNSATVLTSTLDALGTAWTNAATASRPRSRLRKRVFVNTSGFWVFIGSNSATGLLRGTGTKGGFGVGPSTTTASVYVTRNSTDFYCQQEGSASNTGAIITIIEEYNTIP